MKTFVIGSCALALVVLGRGAGAAADETYLLTLDAKASTANGMFAASAPFTGTWIGNYDPVTNPGGTRTLLGAVGFCTAGNQFVPFSGTGTASGSPMTNPTGTFALRIDIPGGRATLYNLDADLLGGGTAVIQTGGTLTYQGFRTCSPTGFFPSAPIPLDFGDAIVTVLTVSQVCSPAAGTLEPDGKGAYTFAVPTVVTLTAAIEFGGEPLDVAPTDLPVVIAGTIAPSGGSAMVTASIDIMSHEDIKGPIQVADDTPVDLPNPLGGTVHLLMDLTLTSVAVDVGADVNIVAAGPAGAPPCLADWNRDAAINSQDFFDFLGDFFAGAADFNCDGLTNSQDFFDFLSAFFAGC